MTKKSIEQLETELEQIKESIRQLKFQEREIAIECYQEEKKREAYESDPSSATEEFNPQLIAELKDKLKDIWDKMDKFEEEETNIVIEIEDKKQIEEMKREKTECSHCGKMVRLINMDEEEDVCKSCARNLRGDDFNSNDDNNEDFDF